MDNVVLSPHALAQTDQTTSHMWQIIVNQMATLVRGEIPTTLVNKEVLESPVLKEKMKKFQESIK